MDSLVVTEVSSFPQVIIFSTGKLSEWKVRELKERLHLVLQHPLAQHALGEMGKVVILKAGADLILVPSSLFLDRFLRVLPFAESVLDLGEAFHDVVRRSNLLIPLLDVEELVPLILAPEFARLNMSELSELLNLCEVMSQECARLVSNYLNLPNLKFNLTSEGNYIIHLLETTLFGGSPRYLAYVTNIGLLPFYYHNVYDVEERYGKIGETSFKTYEELLRWYLGKQYLHDIASSIVRNLLNRAGLEEEDLARVRRILRFLVPVLRKHLPNNVITLGGGVTVRGEERGETPRVVIGEVKVPIGGGHIQELIIEFITDSTVSTLLKFIIDLYSKDRLTLPMLVSSTRYVPINMFFMPLTAFPESRNVRLFLHDIALGLESELGEALTKIVKVGKRIRRLYPRLMLRFNRNSEYMFNVYGYYNLNTRSIELPELDIITSIEDLINWIRKHGLIPPYFIYRKIRLEEPSLIIFKNVETRGGLVTNKALENILQLIEELCRELEAGKIYEVDVETREIKCRE